MQNYHIVWVQCRVITFCGCSAELSHYVCAVQSYHFVCVQCSYHIVWVQCNYHIVWGQCRVITLCGCSAELSHCLGAVQLYHCVGAVQLSHCVCAMQLSHCVGAVQSYHIPPWNFVVQCITSQLSFKGSMRHFENEPCQYNRRHSNKKTERWPHRLVPPVSFNRPREFRLTDHQNFISHTAIFSSYRRENFILETPKLHLTNPRNFPQPTTGLRRN